jgi:hypothetical protein
MLLAIEALLAGLLLSTLCSIARWVIRIIDPLGAQNYEDWCWTRTDMDP